MQTSMRVAILYQALEPPVINGMRKARKPGGYSDSGADIAFNLLKAGVDVVTPEKPNSTKPLSYVYPDTTEGIQRALDAKATVLWANTVVFRGHPIEKVMNKVSIVGQLPAQVEKVDDKFVTNQYLLEHSLPIARSILVDGPVDGEFLSSKGFTLPVVVKPVRGRGSQGVSVAHTLEEVNERVTEVINSVFGKPVIIEEFLSGTEITIAVLPQVGSDSKYVALRPIVRFDHVGDIAPYNGLVPVTANSKAVTVEEANSPVMQRAIDACVKTAELCQSKAIMRIDCRMNAQGEYRLFDVNLKPNLTGKGRPGRENQDSLCTLAAEADGMSYVDLLLRLLKSAWKQEPTQ